VNADPWNDSHYRAFFERVNGFEPYAYQVEVARRLAAGENLIVGAPTGAGKTLTVLTPFLYPGWQPRPARLIYALPLRTLAQGIYREARELAERAGENAADCVTMQTGEQPDDPFFNSGRIVVATYDQVLSGLLCGPYGLGSRLHNVNAAAVVGALVVFDEFHLMEPDRAFLTGAAGLAWFRDLTQSVWMTATATSPLRDTLARAMNAGDASPDARQVAALPNVARVRRQLTYHSDALTPAAILAGSGGRTIVICNTVDRAQATFEALRAALADTDPDVPCFLLHSRFFRSDRAAKEREIVERFGKAGSGRAVLVATQVIEAGVDISCDDLHTECCPMNALVQRAGRCARYPDEQGVVHVYPLAVEQGRWWLPYGTLGEPEAALLATHDLLAQAASDGVALNPLVAAAWVETVHQAADAAILRDAGGVAARLARIRQLTSNAVHRRGPSAVAELIREPSTDDLRVVVAPRQDLPRNYAEREAITLSRWSVKHLLDEMGVDPEPIGWGWRFDDEPGWEPLTTGDALLRYYAVCLAPRVARYTAEVGLQLGMPGNTPSPRRTVPRRPGHVLKVESWAAHARAVEREARRRVEHDDATGWLGDAFARRYQLQPAELRQAAALAGLLHDLGKLQRRWQDWAAAWQKGQDPAHRHAEALAHTTYDPDSIADRARNRGFQPIRGPHAAQSAYLSLALVPERLDPTGDGRLAGLASATLAAILAHHGGWLPKERDLGLDPLWQGWEADLRRAQVNGAVPALVRELYKERDRADLLSDNLELTTSPDTLDDYWPLVAYLVRTLRLADQRATAEAGTDD
jgi:CRISPR-associated endonuclease/helicase Cas3